MAQIRQKDTIIESLLKQVRHGLIYSPHGLRLDEFFIAT